LQVECANTGLEASVPLNILCEYLEMQDARLTPAWEMVEWAEVADGTKPDILRLTDVPCIHKPAWDDFLTHIDGRPLRIPLTPGKQTFGTKLRLVKLATLAQLFREPNLLQTILWWLWHITYERGELWTKDEIRQVLNASIPDGSPVRCLILRYEYEQWMRKRQRKCEASKQNFTYWEFCENIKLTSFFDCWDEQPLTSFDRASWVAKLKIKEKAFKQCFQAGSDAGSYPVSFETTFD
jgi:hypothetical protein